MGEWRAQNTVEAVLTTLQAYADWAPVPMLHQHGILDACAHLMLSVEFRLHAVSFLRQVPAIPAPLSPPSPVPPSPTRAAAGRGENFGPGCRSALVPQGNRTDARTPTLLFPIPESARCAPVSRAHAFVRGLLWDSACFLAWVFSLLVLCGKPTSMCETTAKCSLRLEMEGLHCRHVRRRPTHWLSEVTEGIRLGRWVCLSTYAIYGVRTQSTLLLPGGRYIRLGDVVARNDICFLLFLGNEV